MTPRTLTVILALLSVWFAIPAHAETADTEAELWMDPTVVVGSADPTPPPESGPITTTTTITTTTEKPTDASPQPTPLPGSEGWISWVIGELQSAYREGRWTQFSGLLLMLAMGGFFYLRKRWPQVAVYRWWAKLNPPQKTWIVMFLALVISVSVNVFLAHADFETVVDNAWKAGSAAVTSWKLGVEAILDPPSPKPLLEDPPTAKPPPSTPPLAPATA